MIPTIRELSKQRTIERYRNISEDFRVKGLSVKEIAVARNMTKEGVYTALHRYQTYLEQIGKDRKNSK
jgi:predicted DNA-binding protein YlxM (UPF0122 family)